MKTLSDVLLIKILKKRIGDEAFHALISSENAKLVREFALSLVKSSALPTEILINGRTYEILSFLKEKEAGSCQEMIKQAKKMKASMDQYHGLHILAYQTDIPTCLRSKVIFIFPDWFASFDHIHPYYIRFKGEYWTPNRFELNNVSWDKKITCFVRLKKISS